jgi:glycosyltransferase involved in cell wall biosynthesis
MPELRASHEIRSTLFGDNAHKYIIINVNRNQYRKDIPTSLLGFKQFQDENPNIPAFLYLHMTSMEDMGWDIHLIAEQLGLVIGVDYDLPPVAQQNAGASMKQLRWLYNAADVFLTTTTGEGWGLTVAEAMMCKLPVIAPNTTSLVEIGGDGTRLWPLTEMYPYFAQWDSVQREQCSYYEVADLLLQVYNSPEIRHDKALAAYHFISTLTWEKVCDQWETQFRKLFF